MCLGNGRWIWGTGNDFGEWGMSLRMGDGFGGRFGGWGMFWGMGLGNGECFGEWGMVSRE